MEGKDDAHLSSDSRDASYVCGTVADWAARVDTPVVRFFPDSLTATDVPFEVHRERPTILVFANATDAERYAPIPKAFIVSS